MTPVLILLVCAIAGGGLVMLAADRLAPPHGATTALAGGLGRVGGSARRSQRWLGERPDRTTATGLALTVAVVVIICAGLVLGVLAYLANGEATLHYVDAGAAAWGHDHATRLSTRILTLVTDLGDWPAVPIIAVAILAVELYRLPSRYLAPFLIVVAGGDSVITTAVKDIIDRARPTLNPIARTLGPSFPSGHASTAAAFYAAVALILSRRRGARLRAVLAGGAAALAIAVAASRVLLDVHWLSDVIAGVTLGWAWFAVCAIAFGGRLLRFGVPAEAHATGSSPNDQNTSPPAPRTTREV